MLDLSAIAAAIPPEFFALEGALHTSVAIAFAGLLVWAALSDLKRFIIPNAVSLGLLVLWSFWLLAAPDARAAVDLADAFLSAGAVFCLGLLLFHVGAMGGGDVKLLTVLALWAGPVDTIILMVHVAIAGGILSLLWLTPLRLSLAPVFGWSAAETDRRHVPYGMAIAAGGLMLAGRLFLNQ